MENITIKGILKNPEEKKTKNGASYVEADLTTLQSVIRIKLWDMTLQNLTAYVPNMDKVVSEIVGHYEVYNGFEHFIVQMNPDGPAISIMEGENLDNYEYTCPLPIMAVVKTIKKEISGFKSESLKEIATEAFETMLNHGLTEAPLPPVHTEIGGQIYHLWLLISRIKKRILPEFNGCETPSVNEELMITLAIIENFGKLIPLYDEGEVNKLFFGDMDSAAAFLMRLAPKIDIPTHAREFTLLLHGCLVFSGSVDPVFQEIMLVKSLSDEELNTYRFSETRRFMGDDEVKNSILNLPTTLE